MGDTDSDRCKSVRKILCLPLFAVALLCPVSLFLVAWEFHLTSLPSFKRVKSDYATECQYASDSVHLRLLNSSNESLSLTDAKYNCKCEVSSSGVRWLTFDVNNRVAFDGASVAWQPSHASIRQLALALFGFDLNKSTQFVDGFLLKSPTALCALSTLVSAHYCGRKALTVTDADGMAVWSSDGGAALSQLPTDNGSHIATVNPNDFAEMRNFVKMRIFQIGFNKAATLSTAEYLKAVLGNSSRVMHCAHRNHLRIDAQMRENSNNSQKLLHKMESATGILDFEAAFWRELAGVQYPYALYVLNFRAIHRWLASKLKHHLFAGFDAERVENYFPVLDSEQIELISRNMSAAEMHRFESVLATMRFIDEANGTHNETRRALLSQRRQTTKRAIGGRNATHSTLRKAGNKKAFVENRDYRELSLSAYRMLRFWRIYFYEHMCEVLNAFQNEWRKADSSLLVADIEASDFVEPKLREFIAPYFKLKKGSADQIWHDSAKNAFHYVSPVNAFVSHWSNLYSADYDYNERAVSECICRRVFKFDVSLPQFTRTSFKCGRFSVDALTRFTNEPLSSLQTDF